MNASKRSLFLAAAFAVTVAGGLTGLSMSGETKESVHEQACAHATWPMIPAQCLAGSDADRSVRMLTPAATADWPKSDEQRFASAFN